MDELVRASLDVLNNPDYDQCSSEYKVACYGLLLAMSSGHREALFQLVEHGPVYDGDVISKSLRDDLINFGLANRACVKGEQGYTASNYRGWDVLRSNGGHQMQHQTQIEVGPNGEEAGE